MIGTVAALLVDQQGRVLFGRRSRLKASYAGCSDAPGGHVEPGETVEQALVREVREELGVVARSWTAIGTIDFMEGGRVVACAVHAVSAWDGEPANACDEHDALGWFTPDEVAALPDLASPDYADLARRAVSACALSRRAPHGSYPAAS